MSINKPQKYNGIKFLKIDQSFLKNAKMLHSPVSSINEPSVNINNRNALKKSKSSKDNYLKNLLYNKQRKNPSLKSLSINQNSGVCSPLIKSNLQSSNNLLRIQKPDKIKREFSLSKLGSIKKQLKEIGKKSYSTKNLNYFNVNNRLSKKSLFFHKINNTHNEVGVGIQKNNNKSKSTKEHRKKKRGRKSEKNKNNKTNNDKSRNINNANNNKIEEKQEKINVNNNYIYNTNKVIVSSEITNKNNGNKENENEKKRNKIRKIFCCL